MEPKLAAILQYCRELWPQVTVKTESRSKRDILQSRVFAQPSPEEKRLLDLVNALPGLPDSTIVTTRITLEVPDKIGYEDQKKLERRAENSISGLELFPGPNRNKPTMCLNFTYMAEIYSGTVPVNPELILPESVKRTEVPAPVPKEGWGWWSKLRKVAGFLDSTQLQLIKVVCQQDYQRALETLSREELQKMAEFSQSALQQLDREDERRTENRGSVWRKEQEKERLYNRKRGINGQTKGTLYGRPVNPSQFGEIDEEEFYLAENYGPDRDEQGYGLRVGENEPATPKRTRLNPV